jgi:hypothetical protein
MAKKNRPIIGGLFLIIFAISAGIQLFKYNPLLGVASAVGIFLLGGLILYVMRRKRCVVCSNFLESKKYLWEIDGKKQRVCSHCNQTFMKRQSRAATR